MSWEIIIAGLAGALLSYGFRYKADLSLNFVEYLLIEWKALTKGLVGGGAVILLWPHLGMMVNYLLTKPIEWPGLTWQIAAVIGFAGRKIFELAPRVFGYAAAVFGKRFEK